MSEEEIVRAIKRYFTEHPSASDTIDGIMNWWIDIEVMKISEQEIQHVLDDLCQQNILVKKEILNSLPLYSLKAKSILQ